MAPDRFINEEDNLFVQDDMEDKHYNVLPKDEQEYMEVTREEGESTEEERGTSRENYKIM